MTQTTDNIDESIEKSFRRGEWATQADLTWRHRTKVAKQVVTFSVVHIPSNTRAIGFLSRVNARALVRWLARDVPTLDVPIADGLPSPTPGPAFDKLKSIIQAVEGVHHTKSGRIADVMRETDAARAEKREPRAEGGEAPREGPTPPSAPHGPQGPRASARPATRERRAA